jgi:hypothetical protein
VDRAERGATTVRKASRIACRVVSRCANVNDFSSTDIGEGQGELALRGGRRETCILAKVSNPMIFRAVAFDCRVPANQHRAVRRNVALSDLSAIGHRTAVGGERRQDVLDGRVIGLAVVAIGTKHLDLDGPLGRIAHE